MSARGPGKVGKVATRPRKPSDGLCCCALCGRRGGTGDGRKLRELARALELAAPAEPDAPTCTGDILTGLGPESFDVLYSSVDTLSLMSQIEIKGFHKGRLGSFLQFWLRLQFPRPCYSAFVSPCPSTISFSPRTGSAGCTQSTSQLVSTLVFWGNHLI